MKVLELVGVACLAISSLYTLQSAEDQRLTRLLVENESLKSQIISQCNSS